MENHIENVDLAAFSHMLLDEIEADVALWRKHASGFSDLNDVAGLAAGAACLVSEERILDRILEYLPQEDAKVLYRSTGWCIQDDHDEWVALCERAEEKVAAAQKWPTRVVSPPN